MNVKEIQDKITGDRVAEFSDLKYEELDNISGFGLAPSNAGFEYDESKDTSKHYFIYGEGSSEDRAIKEFWKDYDGKGPYVGNGIFWRLTPVAGNIDIFGEPGNRKVYKVIARFSIGDL